MTSSTSSSKAAGKHVQLQEPLHPASAATGKQCLPASQQPRRSSMDVVRHTLHIPPRSPPCSRPSSVTSPDKGDKAHSHCPRPKIGRLFSSSSREPSPPLSEAEGSESGLVSSEEKRPPPPQRKMSLKLGSGFRSRGRRAVSEVNTSDATLLRTDSTVSSLASPPVSPTGPSHSSTLANLRNFLGSPSGKPKARRAASEQVVAVAVPPGPLGRHELMAEARRYREREARLYAAAHSPSAKRRETPVDMSGKSQLTMAEHFA